MPAYNYTSINEKGRSIRGSMVAENDIDLEARLKEIGLDLVTFKEQKIKRAGKSKIKLKDMIILCLHLEQLCAQACRSTKRWPMCAIRRNPKSCATS